MPNNKKPRKQYTPKRPSMPLTFGLDESSARNMKLISHQELDKLRDGVGDEMSWNTIVARLNHGCVLAMQLDFNEESRWALRDALDAMRKIASAWDGQGHYVATAEQINDIADGLLVTDEIQDGSTRREQQTALKVVMQVAM